MAVPGSGVVDTEFVGTEVAGTAGELRRGSDCCIRTGLDPEADSSVRHLLARNQQGTKHTYPLITGLIVALPRRLRRAVGLVGVSELLESVAEPPDSFTRCTTLRFVVLAIGQIIITS